MGTSPLSLSIIASRPSHSLYRFHTDPSEIENLVANLRDHLSFGESDGLEAMIERESGDVPIDDPEPDHSGP